MKLQNIIVTCFALQLIGTAYTLRSLQIQVPHAVLLGKDADLMCTYDLEGAQLYSIKWYRHMVEFYRYVPKESPPTKVFPVAEIKVDVAMSDEHRVVLRDVGRSLTGEYQCEVSADAPLFHTDIKVSEMVIVEPPLLGPNVMSDQLTYSGGDHIKVNCTSPPSYPAANITWYVNEQMVPALTMIQASNYSNGCVSSVATLALQVAIPPAPTVMIRCEAALFDVWSGESHTLVMKERNSNPASALGRLTGGAADFCFPTIMLFLFEYSLQFFMDCYAETPTR